MKASKIPKELKAELADMGPKELYQKVAETIVLFSNMRKAGPASSWTEKAALPTAEHIVTLVACWIHAKDKE